MQCPRCGANTFLGAAFCGACGAPLPGGAADRGFPPGAAGSSQAFARPLGVTVLALLAGVGGVLGVVAVLLLLGLATAAPSGPAAEREVVMIAGGLWLAIALVHVATAVGLWRLRPWGRTLQMVLAAISLIGVPIGTIVGGLILYYMTRPGVKLVFSGRRPSELTPAELAAVEADGRGLAVVVIGVLAVVAASIAVLGIVAAVAIPSLVRARISGNEAAAIGQIRSMISAQMAFAAANGNAYGEPRCLLSPSECIPGYAPSDPAFLAPETASPERSGYRFEFHAGGSAGETGGSAGVEAGGTGMTSFAYTAEPMQPGETGARAFCGDATGTICEFAGGRLPPIDGGGCPAGCPVLGSRP